MILYRPRGPNTFTSFSRCAVRNVGLSRGMATVHDSIPHTIRTANDPRQTGLYDATLSQIEQVNSKTRLLKLSLPRDGPPLRHLPGQWLDVHIPHIPQAGGFTITSPPFTCLTSPRLSTSPRSESESSTDQSRSPTEPQHPSIELAIQNSANPPAAFFHNPPASILGTQLQVRVGGRFVYPPPELSYNECLNITRSVFVAGGVGINPVMSMVSAMHGLGVGKVGGMVQNIRVLYGTKRSKNATGASEEVLFRRRLKRIAEAWEGSTDVDFHLGMYETGGQDGELGDEEGQKDDTGTDGTIETGTRAWQHLYRRITHADLLEAIGPEDVRANTVAYVCGPPAMTDEFVRVLKQAKGMEDRRVLCEKWW